MEELFNDPDRLWIANHSDSDDLVCFHNSCLADVIFSHELPYLLHGVKISIDINTIRPAVSDDSCPNIEKCKYNPNSEFKQYLQDFASNNPTFNIKTEEKGNDNIITCGSVPKFVGQGKVAHVDNIIMCFAVFVCHHRGDGELDGVIAGHFVTPKMVSKGAMPELLDRGVFFVNRILSLMTEKGWEWDSNTELQIWLNGAAKALNNSSWDLYIPAARTLKHALRNNEAAAIRFTTGEPSYKEVFIKIPQ